MGPIWDPQMDPISGPILDPILDPQIGCMPLKGVSAQGSKYGPYPGAKIGHFWTPFWASKWVSKSGHILSTFAQDLIRTRSGSGDPDHPF